MNVIMRREFNWSSIQQHRGQYRVVQSTADVTMISNSIDAGELDTAFNRIKYWFHQVMQDSVILTQDQDPIWDTVPLRIIRLPDQACDQIVGMMLWAKLNAICEDRLRITQTEVSSDWGEWIQYRHDEDESAGPFQDPGWWHDPGLVWGPGRESMASDGNIIHLTKDMDWRDVDLAWPQAESQSESAHSDDTVVFGKFGPDAT